MALEVDIILTKLAEKNGKKFTYQGEELPLERVFAFDGGLPLLVRRANTLGDFLFGRQLQISFKDDPEALTGEKIVLGDSQEAFILVMLLYDMLEEMVVNAADGDVVLQ